jgi:hypothetical protein
MTTWDCFMLRDELAMLECRLETMAAYPDVKHVLVESPITHRGVAKPLHYADNRERFAPYAHRIVPMVADTPINREPWNVEHAQRNTAWLHIGRYARPGDMVLICDVDEIPSAAMMAWPGDMVASVYMRTFLFAVDWEVRKELPPTCVVATAGYLRMQAAAGAGLAEVRDRRDLYPSIHDGGWHMSWLGGPEKQREKLETATCHTELIGTREGDLILSGARYRTSEDGGGLPVVPVDVDSTWPAYVFERRCPASWFRPRED